MLQRKQLSRDQALQKIKHYCSYQERSHAEVKEKLYSFGLWKKDVEPIISELIEENYLNEERFARLYAGGHFRMKHWGRIKIRYELKQKQISDYCIKKGLTEIDDEAYQQTLKKLFDQKWNSLTSEKNILVRKSKTLSYLLQKGYERDLAMALINS